MLHHYTARSIIFSTSHRFRVDTQYWPKIVDGHVFRVYPRKVNQQGALAHELNNQTIKIIFECIHITSGIQTPVV